jgi:hypothetical protein
MSSPEIQKRQLFYDYCMQTNNWLRDSNEKINTRFSNILTLDSSVLTILFGLAYFLFQSGTACLPHNTVLAVSLGVSMLFFLVAIAFGVLYYRPTDFDFADPSILIERLKSMSHEKVLGGMAATIAKQVSNNMDVVNERGGKLRWTMTLTAVGFVVVFLTASLLIYASLLPQSCGLHSG